MKAYKEPEMISVVGKSAEAECHGAGKSNGPGMGKGVIDPSSKMKGPKPPEDNIKSHCEKE